MIVFHDGVHESKFRTVKEVMKEGISQSGRFNSEAGKLVLQRLKAVVDSMPVVVIAQNDSAAQVQEKV